MTAPWSYITRWNSTRSTANLISSSILDGGDGGGGSGGGAISGNSRRMARIFTAFLHLLNWDIDRGSPPLPFPLPLSFSLSLFLSRWMRELRREGSTWFFDSRRPLNTAINSTVYELPDSFICFFRCSPVTSKLIA